MTEPVRRHTIELEARGETVVVRVTDHQSGKLHMAIARSYPEALITFVHGVITEGNGKRPEGGDHE